MKVWRLSFSCDIARRYAEHRQNEHTTANGGYVLKNAPGEEIIDGICTVFENKKFICDAVHQLIKKQDNNSLFLSRREIQILSHIAAGDTTREIADKLFISVFTVETHRKNLLTKLNARNMVSLIKIAMDYKYI